MHTPIYDYLSQYAASDSIRMHMPGHKGRFCPPAFQQAAKFDITEIYNADSLFEANGIIAESETNAAKLFGTSYTFYSCAGSTLCIQAMLLLMKQEGREVIAARNVHRSFLNACTLLDLPVHWVYPRENCGFLSGRYHPDDFTAVLEKIHRPACVYVTSPDYLGNMADVAAISGVCKKYSAKLLVDNAHGAHLAFLSHRCHPMQLGADFCCDSTHKMLSGLTGTAYLHVGSQTVVEPKRIRNAMAMFGSTSPSYLMLASLDWCNRELSSPLFREQLSEVTRQTTRLRKHKADRYHFVHGEPLHLTIDAMKSGMDGRELAAYLIDNQLVPEYYDAYFVVLLCSAATRPEELNRLEQVLDDFSPTQPPKSHRPCLPHTESACGIREATLAPQEHILIERAKGRICAAVDIPCPPAVPIVLSGERINAACIAVCTEYGIQEISVVK
ncbi:MAG: aminotransferase class V-fold PLP-dependent enzyme [Ruminococcus sp.]|nr:aminotransferase class V-fold PLP-dependent enzyme [Ruminococcus sp.]